MKIKVFIDGNTGTTGLRLSTLLSRRNDISIIPIDPTWQKDSSERINRMNSADVVFLCLPDNASKEAAGMISNPNTCVIDTSSAFRVHEEWVYGLPELDDDQRNRIRKSKRISNPGGHASAFILSVRPLIDAGLLANNHPISAFAFTGYSEGGKMIIDSYEAAGAPPPPTPQPYALNLNHKHLSEMVYYTGLSINPVFIPFIGSFYRGLSLWTPLTIEGVTPEIIYEKYEERYNNESFINIHKPHPHDIESDYFFDVEGNNNSNRIDLYIFGNDDRQCIVARLDNLGKGAAGSAIQNLNIHMGISETLGLNDFI